MEKISDICTPIQNGNKKVYISDNQIVVLFQV